jgi:ubiquinone/menaquinone biosynthesis C-methylase UbiE
LISKLFVIICRIFPSLRRLLWRRLYQLLAGLYKREDWIFMNYGYAPLVPGEGDISLDDDDELDRYFIQLYHHVAGAIDLERLDVLEVGSGRGGGAYYIMRYLKPRSVVGVDFSEKAVAFCNSNYSVQGLSFLQGDAESLPFDDNSFDAVVNVESSHCYSSMDAFLAQVRRILRPGGYLLYADLRDRDRIEMLNEQLSRSGMRLIKRFDITRNVIEAMNQDSDRKMELIGESVPRLFLNSFKEFAGIRGSAIYEGLSAGEVIYQSFVLQKSEDGW